LSINRFYAYSNPRALASSREQESGRLCQGIDPEQKMGDRVRETDKPVVKIPVLLKLLTDPAISFHLKKGAKLVWIFRNAYPQIHVPWLKTQRRSFAIGSGYAFVMGYLVNPRKPPPPSIDQKPKTFRSSAKTIRRGLSHRFFSKMKFNVPPQNWILPLP